MKEVLLDTNAYVAFRQGQAEAVDIVRHAAYVALNTDLFRQRMDKNSVIKHV
jgi:hypothetical protein